MVTFISLRIAGFRNILDTSCSSTLLPPPPRTFHPPCNRRLPLALSMASRQCIRDFPAEHMAALEGRRHSCLARGPDLLLCSAVCLPPALAVSQCLLQQLTCRGFLSCLLKCSHHRLPCRGTSSKCHHTPLVVRTRTAGGGAKREREGWLVILYR